MLSLIVKDKPRSISTEAYRTLRTNLEFYTKGRNMKRIVITSAESGEGKSVTTSNLALSFSQSGKKILVLDCDIRRPNIHEYFNIFNHIGFADLIINKLDFKDVIQKYSDNLHIITAGKTLINPSELLNIENILPVFEHLQNQYDIILIDSPPVITFTDAQLLSAVSDGVIMILSMGETRKKLCKKALQLLSNVNANIIGMILNKDSKRASSYYSKKDYFDHKRAKVKKRKLSNNELY